MTDLDLQPHLHRALTEATDHLRSPDLADRALAGASRRRARRTTLAALAAVVLLGGGVTWVVQDRVPRAGVVDTPSPSPSPTTPPTVTSTDPATQPIWDPFTIVDAPRHPSTLPELIAPPADPPTITDQPLPDIVLAWPEEGLDLRVLATDGEWRTLPGTATAGTGNLYDVVRPAISPDGRRVAMSTNEGILVVEATTGEQRVIDWPAGLAGPWDTLPALLWLPGDEGFVVLHWEQPWLVDFDGNGEPAPFGGKYSGGVMVDPDLGIIRESRWQNPSILTWDGDDLVDRVPRRGYGERFVTRYGMAAYTGSPGQFDMGVMKSGPIVVDTATGEVLGYAPIRDADAVYSDNGHLTSVGFLDKVTVVMLVTPMNFTTMKPEDGVTHVVTWNFRTGDFGLMASLRPGMRSIAVAPALLGQ